MTNAPFPLSAIAHYKILSAEKPVCVPSVTGTFFHCFMIQNEPLLDKRLSALSANFKGDFLLLIKEFVLTTSNWRHSESVTQLNDDPIMMDSAMFDKSRQPCVLSPEIIAQIQAYAKAPVQVGRFLFDGPDFDIGVGFSHFHLDCIDSIGRADRAAMTKFLTVTFFPEGVAGGTRYLDLPRLDMDNLKSFLIKNNGLLNQKIPMLMSRIEMQVNLAIQDMLSDHSVLRQLVPFIQRTESGVVYDGLTTFFFHASPEKNVGPRLHYVLSRVPTASLYGKDVE